MKEVLKDINNYWETIEKRADIDKRGEAQSFWSLNLAERICGDCHQESISNSIAESISTSEDDDE